MKNGELCASGIVPTFTDTLGVVGMSGLLGAAGAAALAGAGGADWTGGAGAVGAARPAQASSNRVGITSQVGEPKPSFTASSFYDGPGWPPHRRSRKPVR